jgi:hypothetical protein
MAGLIYTAATQAELATGVVEYSPIILLPPDVNTRLKLKRWSIGFDGTDPLAAPVQVILARTTTAGTYTNTLTPALNGPGSEVSRAVAKTLGTSLPTKGNILDVIEIHPQSSYEVILPLGDEIIIPGSAGTAGIALYVTAAATVNCLAKFIYEE